MHDDRRAAHVVTPWSRHGVEDRLGLDPAQADMVPACSAIVQGKHQPLQWNIGRVHR
jgi:hypothetical protein